ncbi:hypothetical protein FLGSB24_11280 [Flavobacterium sp. GSB-24]|nr:hypothetical protein FLGSB24_11280 [Flavobacterium sp. GSB-24]
MIKDAKVALSENNLSKLEGTYELFPDLKYDEKSKVKPIASEDSKINHSLNYFVSSKQVKYDSKSKYSVEVKLINKNTIKFITKKETAKIDSIELSGKLKNGLFYLDNKFLKRNGVPYLAGGFTNYKTRIGLAKDNGLLVNYAYDNSGAILFLFWAGSAYNLGYHYNRIK